MVNYKVTSFDFREFGEVLRLILHYGKMDFEDDRIPFDDWPKFKQTTPYGQLPMLTVDGVEIAQQFACARLLAKRFGLVGKDDVEAAILDSIADLYRDFFVAAEPYILVREGFRQGDQEKLFKDIFEPAVNKYFPMIVKALKKSGSGFFAKSGVSWVDFYIANNVQTILNFDPQVLDKYPELKEHHKKVHSIPELQKYLSERKETQI